MPNDLKFSITGDPSKAKKAFAEVKGAAEDTFKGIGAMAAGAAAGLGAIGYSVISTSAEFERFKTQLETIEGSSSKAQQSMDWITEFAKETPYELAGITDAFVTLKAYGIDPVDGTLKTLGDTAAAMGKPLKQGVEALADAMTGEFERLKEFGIKASVVGDQVSFAYTQNGQQMTATADKNSQQMIQATLQGIWNDKYAGGMDKLSKTWSGMTSNLGDHWQKFNEQIGDKGSFEAAKGVLSVFLDEINNNKDGVDDLATSISDGLVSSMQIGIFAAAELAKGFTTLTVVDDMLRLGIDKTSGVVVDAIRAELEGISGLLMMAERLTGADLGSAAVEETLASMNELRRGIRISETESANALGDAAIEAQNSIDKIDGLSQKLFLATESARNIAHNKTGKDDTGKKDKNKNNGGKTDDPAIAKALADAQKVVDIHSAKFAKIQALAQQSDMETQDRLLAANDFDLAQLDVEQQRMADALATQGASKQQLADLETYYDDLKLQRAQETSDAITAIEVAEDEARLQRLSDGQQAAYDIKGQFNQLFNDQQQVHLSSLAGNLGAYAKTAADWDKWTGDQKLGFAASTFGALSGLMTSENKKQFEIGKKAARAENAVNTYLGATKALQAFAGMGPIGVGLGFAAAAVVVGAGMANDRKISSSQMGGGASAGSVPTVSAGGGGASPTVTNNPTTGLPAPAPTTQQTPAPSAPNQYTFHIGAGVDEAMVRDTIVPIIRDLDENGEVTVLSENGVTAQRIRDAA